MVNPNRSDCPYPNKALCGAGVAFKVCQALAASAAASAELLHEHLELVALATVADMVPPKWEAICLVHWNGVDEA